jgi:hypothetical protein
MRLSELQQNYWEFLDLFSLTAEEVIVGAGGAMVVHGLRNETEDIDVAVGCANFEKLAHLPFHYFPRGGKRILVREYKRLLVDVHEDDDLTGEIKNGVNVHSLQKLLAFKLSLNREKDQADIAVLKRHVG